MSVIVNIDHETGDLTQYTGSATDSGDLSVAAGAALASTNYGLSCLIDDTNNIYAYKTFTAPTTAARVRLYIDPNSLTMAANDAFTFFFFGSSGGSTRIGDITLYRDVTNHYEIISHANNDAGAVAATIGTGDITDAPHYVEFHIVRAASAISSDGTAAFYLDGVQVGVTATGIDNYDFFSTTVRAYVGVIYADAGTSGTLYLDELVVNNDGSLIGPVITSTINLLAGKLDKRGKL